MAGFIALEPVAEFDVGDVHFTVHYESLPGFRSGDFTLYAAAGDNEGRFFIGKTAKACSTYARRNVFTIRAKLAKGPTS